MLHMVSFLCILSLLGYTEKSWRIFWAIHTETKPQYILKLNISCIIIDYMMRLMKSNLQVNKKMIKMNKQKYYDVSFRYGRAS